MKRGDFYYHITDQGIAFFWKDDRSFHMLSNYHVNHICTVGRTQKVGTKIQVSAPSIIKHYNEQILGIGKADMLSSFSDGNRKSNKWWHSLFFGMIEIFHVDSYIAFIETRETVYVLNYKRNVTQGLVTLSREEPKRRGRPSSGNKTVINVACTSSKIKR